MPFLADYQNIVKAHKLTLAPSVSMLLDKLDANKDAAKFVELKNAALAGMTKYNDTLTDQVKAEKDIDKKMAMSKFGNDFRKFLQTVKAVPAPKEEKAPTAPPQPPAKPLPPTPSKFLVDYQNMIKTHKVLITPSVSSALSRIDTNKDGTKTAALCKAAVDAMNKFNDKLTADLKAQPDPNTKVAMSKLGADFRKLLQTVKAHK
jgi:hypothetical protein